MNLKKTLVAAAVAAVAAAPAISHAQATLYGKIQYALIQSGKTTDSGKAETNFVDNGNRLGVKGSDPLGSDMTSFYKLEFDIHALGESTKSWKSTTSSQVYTRYAYAGVKGNFGTVVGGRVEDLFYAMVEAPTDTVNVIGGSLGPTGTGYTSRVDAVAYMTPNMGGFTGGVAVGTIGTDNNTTSSTYGKQQQVYQLGGKYTFGPGYVGAGYISVPKANQAIGANGTKVKGVAGISAGYSFGMFGIDGNVTKTQAGTDATNKDAYRITQATLQGSMTMGSLFGYVMYSQAKSAESGAKTMHRVTAGVFYNVSKPLMVSFEVASNNKYANGGTFSETTATSNGDKANTEFAVGLAYSF
ncbi:MAG: porin [Acidihalobacter sp.]